MTAGKKLATTLGLLAACAFGCSNVLESSAKKTTDEAYYEEATKAVNNSRWDDAISYFEKMSTGFASKTVVREDFAGALAGKCGLNFIEFVQSLKSSTGSIFLFSMNAWTGKTISPAHCLRAEKMIRSIWDTETPSTKQKFFMAIVGLAKMGAYLRSKADVDGVDNLGDGTTDTAFNACDATVAGPNNLEDDEVGQVLTGLMLFVTNIADFAADVGSGSADTTSITDLCADLVAQGQPNPCDSTNWDAISADVKDDLVVMMRALLATGATSKDDPAVDPGNDLRQTLGITSPYHAANAAIGYMTDGSCARDPFIGCCL